MKLRSAVILEIEHILPATLVSFCALSSSGVQRFERLRVRRVKEVPRYIGIPQIMLLALQPFLIALFFIARYHMLTNIC